MNSFSEPFNNQQQQDFYIPIGYLPPNDQDSNYSQKMETTEDSSQLQQQKNNKTTYPSQKYPIPSEDNEYDGINTQGCSAAEQPTFPESINNKTYPSCQKYQRDTAKYPVVFDDDDNDSEISFVDFNQK